MIVKVGKTGNPPWRTPDGKGDWGGNLGPPTGICANQTSVVSAWVCVEDGQITGVQRMDADGNIQMRYSTFYPWDCRFGAAMDEKNLYLCILHDNALQIAEYALDNPRGRILMNVPTNMTVQPGHAAPVINAMALTPDRIFATIEANGELIVIDRAAGKILSTVATPHAWGVAVVKDRLLVASDGQVARFTLDGTPDGALVGKGQVASPTALCVGDDGVVYVADTETNQVHAFDAAGKHLRALGKAGGANGNGAYDGQNGFGGGVWMCMGPRNKLFVNDIASGFFRTSRWSTTGTCENEWFSVQLDNFAPSVNSARPNELVHVNGEFDPSNIQAWEIDPVAKTWHPAWHYSAPHTASWHDDVIRGYEHGGLPLKKENGYPGTWPLFGYGGGLATFKGRNYMISASGAIFTYGPDAPPKLVAMALTHRVELQGDVYQSFYNGGPNNWVTWADRNGDGNVQKDEVVMAEHPEALGNAQWLRAGFDSEGNILLLRWTEPDYLNGKPTMICRLPLLEVLPDGVPIYDFNKVETLVALAKPNLDGGGAGRVTGAYMEGAVDGGDAWYAIVDAGGNHEKLSGIDGDGWWASRNWRKRICRFDKKTGACRWAVGRRAPGLAQPGEMYNPMMLAGVAGGAVFAADALGVAWVWDEDGLYLGRLYNGPEDKKADANSMYAEMMGARVLTVGDEIRIIANDVGASVHDVHLPKRTPVVVKPVTLTSELATRAKPWDPDGTPPLQKPTLRAQSLAAHHAEAPITVDGKIDPREGWLGLADGARVDAAEIWLDGQRLATARALYDDRMLYLAYDVRSVTPPVNAGTELPICPFVSGAYVDASFAPDWSQPQRTEACEGDVRVLVAQVGAAGGAAQLFQRGYWQKKAHGTGAQTITSPAASVHLEQIAEIPGLQQAWAVGGIDNGRVVWQLELAIPLAAVGLTQPNGRAVGFDTSIGIANAAGNGRERAAHWGGLSEAAVVDRPGSSRLLPENWGTLIFLDR